MILSPTGLFFKSFFDFSVHPLILRWLTHYLSSGSQYVCVSGASSDILPVASGVPQGSVLGSLLFIIYVNNITTVPLSAGSMTLYADDILLYHPISTSSDFHFLQEDINNLCSWTDDNYLNFNASKCKYMIISKKKQPILPDSPLSVNNHSLERVTSYKYLGVWLTSTLNWSIQVSEVCSRTRRQIGFIVNSMVINLTATLFNLCSPITGVCCPSVGPTSSRTY